MHKEICCNNTKKGEIAKKLNENKDDIHATNFWFSLYQSIYREDRKIPAKAVQKIFAQSKEDRKIVEKEGLKQQLIFAIFFKINFFFFFKVHFSSEKKGSLDHLAFKF